MYLYQLPKLKDIYDEFVVSDNLTENENHDIVESFCNIIDYYITNNPLSFSDPKFHENLSEYVEIFINLQFPFSFNNRLQNSLTEDLHYELKDLQHEAESIYFKHIIPKRSYPKTFIRNKKINIPEMTKKIQYIKSVPQPDQRTDEWYYFRHNLLTASSAWKCLASESSRNQIIYEKCQPINVGKFRSSNITTPFHWGQKYEPVSVMLYEKKYKTTVEDFGCIKHNKYSFLGASPDGINTNESSLLYGRMLEIKNIFNREITGIPKQEYWIQMQLQMETCDLNECDFLETRFKEYKSDEEFYADGTFAYTKDNKRKGIIMHFNKDGFAHYEYCPLFSKNDSDEKCRKKFEKWEEEMMEKNSEMMWVSNVYWYLDEVSCVLVLRNKLWFKEAVEKLQETWSIIEKERITGCEHRAPKKRNKVNKENITNKLFVTKTEEELNKRKNSAEKIKTSPQLTAIKQQQLNNSNNTIPIIKVLTGNLSPTIKEDDCDDELHNDELNTDEKNNDEDNKKDNNNQIDNFVL